MSLSDNKSLEKSGWNDVERTLETVSDDDVQLKSMGKMAQLKRVYNIWTLCAYQIMIMCSWSCNVILYGTVFDLGSPMSLVWGTLVVAGGQTILMTSPAEFCSIWPTAGGQQYYTQALATGKLRPFLSYVVGWAVLFGEISMSSSCALNSAGIIESFIGNFFPRSLPASNVLGAIWTIGFGLAWDINFLVLAPKQDANFVFSLFLNNSGYTSKGWVFIMSLYAPIFGLYGTDGILHLVEEIENPSRLAPRAIVGSMILCDLTSWASVLVMLFCAGNWESYLGDTQPYMAWFMDIFSSVYGGGVFCAVANNGINYFVIVGTNTAASRLAWSMARDFAFPFSEWFAIISPRFGIPVRTLTGVFVLDLILGLIVLGSDYAFQAIVSCGGVSIQIGYVIPIIILLVRGRKILPPHPNFDLGRFGPLVNVLSVGWSLLIITMLFFPMYVPVDSTSLGNMNWSIAVIGGVMLLPGIRSGALDMNTSKMAVP